MEDKEQLDKTYDYIIKTFVERGYAPHFTEIANKFGVKMEAGKTLLNDLIYR